MTLVVLVICFLLGMAMVIVAVMAARNLREKERCAPRETARQRDGVKRSTQAAFVNSLTRRNPAPTGKKVAINYGSNSISSASSEPALQLPGEDSQFKMAKMQDDLRAAVKSDDKSLLLSVSGELISPPGETGMGTIDERTRLLERPSSPESFSVMTGGFGNLPDSGIWIRDIPGKDVTKVLILLVFLLFSCAVVSL